MRLMYFAMGGIAPFNIGGTSTVAYNLIRNLDKQGIEMDVVTVILRENMPGEGLNKFFGVSDNVTFHPIIKENYDSRKGAVKGMFELCNLVRKRKPDAIHYNLFPSKREALVPFVARIIRIPQVYTYHGRFWKEVEENYSKPVSTFKKVQFKLYRNFFSKIIVNSKAMIDHALNEGFSGKRIYCIPNGVDIHNLNAQKPAHLDGGPAILFVGRLEKIKGIEILIQAFSRVINVHEDAKLHIVGEGSLHKELQYLSSHLGIRKAIIFHGFKPNVASYFSTADMAVFPSEYDPSGIVLLESMASKCPTICSDRGAVREIITDGVNGILTSTDVGELAKKIIMLGEENALRSSVQSNAYSTVQKYTWENIASRYVALYRKLVKSKK